MPLRRLANSNLRDNKTMKKFEVVKMDDGSFEVKYQPRKNGKWFTAADVYCIPEIGTTTDVGQIIADALNKYLSLIKNK